MLDLVFRHKTSLSRANDVNAAQAASDFARSRQSVIRTNLICEGCGLRSRPAAGKPSGYFDVHHIDDDHQHNEASNHALVCPLCHSTFTCGMRGTDFMKGVEAEGVFSVILYPEISQRTLNQMVHTFYLAKHGLRLLNEPQLDKPTPDGETVAWKPLMSEEADYKAGLQTVMDNVGPMLESIRAEGAERSERIFGTSNSVNFRQALMDIEIGLVQTHQATVFKDLRVLGNDSELHVAYAHWFSLFSRAMPPHVWFSK